MAAWTRESSKKDAMFSPRLFLIILTVLISTTAARSPAWGQCGSSGRSGSTDSSTSMSTTKPGSITPTVLTDLHTLAKSKGKLYFGSATDNPQLSDTAYVKYLSNANMFGQLTPGNALKWDTTEPSRGTFNFSNADAIVNLARKNGQIIRGHTCTWYKQLPNWVKDGNFDAPTLTSILQSHCSTVVGKYKGQIYSWDVVNEPFNDNGTLRSFVLYDTLGKSYIDIALQSARAADPDTKLYINDYNIDGLGTKSSAMYNLVKDLKARNIPIDGIGVQGHLLVGAIPTTIQQNLEQFASLGVEVAITELDIRMTLPVTDAKLEQQRKDYETVIKACNAVSRCIGITIWDYMDKWSWIPSVFPGQGAALPWDENLKAKPAYAGIVSGFQ